MQTLSITKYEQATGGAAVSRSNVETYYKLACLRQSRGALAEAGELFEKILAFDYQYSDVSARLESVRNTASTHPHKDKSCSPNSSPKPFAVRSPVRASKADASSPPKAPKRTRSKVTLFGYKTAMLT